MMVSMRLQKIMAVTVVLALLTAMAAGLSVWNTRNSVASPTWTMISRFVVVLVFGTFGLAVARESQLQGSLLINVEEWSLTVRDIINYGVLPGFVLGLINYFFFFTYRYSPLVAPRIRDMQSIYDSFVISLDSGMAEEVVYRLFILFCFLSDTCTHGLRRFGQVSSRFCRRLYPSFSHRCFLRWFTTFMASRPRSL